MPNPPRTQEPLNIPHSSHIALLFASLSLSSFSFSSFTFSLLFLSFSLTAFSYAFPSSVFFGALTPNAPAIILPAAALLFSGLLSKPACGERLVLIDEDKG